MRSNVERMEAAVRLPSAPWPSRHDHAPCAPDLIYRRLAAIHSAAQTQPELKGPGAMSAVDAALAASRAWRAVAAGAGGAPVAAAPDAQVMLLTGAAAVEPQPPPPVHSAAPPRAGASLAAKPVSSTWAESAGSAAEAAAVSVGAATGVLADMDGDGDIDAADAKIAYRLSMSVPMTSVLLLGAFGLGMVSGWKLLRTKINMVRFRTVDDIPSAYFAAAGTKSNGKGIRGVVASVTDGDTFRLYHKPPLNSPLDKSAGKLSETSLQIRIAAIDTPETKKFGEHTHANELRNAFFKTKIVQLPMQTHYRGRSNRNQLPFSSGKPGQPFGPEAKDQLATYLEEAGSSLMVYPQSRCENGLFLNLLITTDDLSRKVRDTHDEN